MEAKSLEVRRWRRPDSGSPGEALQGAVMWRAAAPAVCCLILF